MADAKREPTTLAYVLPFGIFMALLGVLELLALLDLSLPEPFTNVYVIFPLQTVLCGIALAIFWKRYEWGSFLWWWAGVALGLFVLAIWISPQWVLGFQERLDGYNPNVFEPGSVLYYVNISLRLLRLVLVVPLLEEIFWRGFLMRYVIQERWREVPFGTFSWLSFGVVTLFFGLAHWGHDFVPALITGALYNLLAIWTRSLGVCVLAHAVTNLGLGIYVMTTRQWGFW